MEGVSESFPLAQQQAWSYLKSRQEMRWCWSLMTWEGPTSSHVAGGLLWHTCGHFKFSPICDLST